MTSSSSGQSCRRNGNVAVRLHSRARTCSRRTGVWSRNDTRLSQVHSRRKNINCPRQKNYSAARLKKTWFSALNRRVRANGRSNRWNVPPYQPSRAPPGKPKTAPWADAPFGWRRDTSAARPKRRKFKTRLAHCAALVGNCQHDLWQLNHNFAAQRFALDDGLSQRCLSPDTFGPRAVVRCSMRLVAIVESESRS